MMLRDTSYGIQLIAKLIVGRDVSLNEPKLSKEGEKVQFSITNIGKLLILCVVEGDKLVIYIINSDPY